MKPFTTILLAGILFPAATNAAAQAAIEGKVQLPKPPPPKVSPARYQGQPNLAPAVDPPAAVIYLEGSFPEPASTNLLVELSQKDFRFATSLLPVQRGTRVLFPNRDDGYHNVFSYSKPRRFDLGRYRNDESPPSQVFDQPGAVKLYCEIHDHMRSTILVLDTPYFVKTDSEGNFRLDNLPSGNFLLKAWLDDKTVLAQPVQLDHDKKLRVDFPAK